jgi:5-methyltetrahydrofolate--homocysteine methyltransferase
MIVSTVELLSEALQKGRVRDVLALLQTGLDEGLSAQELLEDGLLKGMGLLGVRFKANEVFVPEVLIAARALNKGAEFLKPKLVEAGVRAKGKAVIGTVKGDMHDIGKNLVKMMMEGAGFDVVDLGVDVPESEFVAAVKEHQPDVLCLSALLTTTMGQQKVVVDSLTAAGVRGDVKVLIGGAPVTQTYCDQIGADGYTEDAASCAELATAIVTAA